MGAAGAGTGYVFRVLDRLYREREDDEESIQRFIKVQPLKGEED
jgi:hypothetical protein